MFNGYVALGVSVTPLVTPRVVKRDQTDDHVIACAIAARADVIVSGDLDLDLFDIGSYTVILTDPP